MKRAIILLGLSIGAVMYVSKSMAEPIAQVERGSIKVIIYSDKCSLEAVSNLPFRATWIENGEITEGCVDLDVKMKLLKFYFADRTVVTMPMHYFSKLFST